MKGKFSERLLVGVTGCKEGDWKNKLKEIEQRKISKIALFLERFERYQRDKIYDSLLNSVVKKIPLVHIRHDMVKEELDFLSKNFDSTYFTIHEDHFEILEKWKGYHKNLYLEMNTDNFVSNLVKVKRIGGFCIDLSHFKVAEQKSSEDFNYVLQYRESHEYFVCNHLNGYSYEKNTDLHMVRDVKDLDYLKSLPKFLFGKWIGLEMDNSISGQLKFKKHIEKILEKNFQYLS